MCWDNLEESQGKVPYEETDDEGGKCVRDTELKDEEEHVNSTLHMGN